MSGNRVTVVTVVAIGSYTESHDFVVSVDKLMVESPNWTGLKTDLLGLRFSNFG